MIGLPIEKRLAILREYDAGGASHRELAEKYGVGVSTLSTWHRRMPSPERKCTVCGAPPPPKAIAYRGSLLCAACSRAKKTATHRVYYVAHKEEIDSASAYSKRSSLSKAKDRDRAAEQYFRNQETLKRLLKKMVHRIVDWGDYSLVGREQLSNPTFIVVDKSGAKRKEVLTEPLPSWD